MKKMLFRKMMAVLLSAVMLVGILSGASPVGVLIQDDTGLSIVKENMAETRSSLSENKIMRMESITDSVTWNDETISDITISGGTESNPVVITVSGSVEINGTLSIDSGYVRFTGGGTLNFLSNSANAIVVQEGADVTFENVALDGANYTWSSSALLLYGNVTLKSGTSIRHFQSTGGSGAYAGRKGVIAVYGKGVLNIYDGVTITGNTCKSGIIALYQADDGAYSNPSTAIVNMYGGNITENTVNNSNLGVIWNWCGNLNISGGTVTAAGSEYAVYTQGNAGGYNADTTISGGTFAGNTTGAVCAGKDSGNKSTITITGGIFTGKIAATVNYGTIDIQGGRYTGTDYALSSNGNGSGTLNVQGGEFLGNKTAYQGEIATKTQKVIVGDSADSVKNWDKSTSLNSYKYVAIGEVAELPVDKGWNLTSDGTLTITSDAGMEDWLKHGGSSEQQVTTIVLQEGVTYIGEWAFNGCENLTQATIPSSVTSIGDSAFNRCKKLESIEIPSNVEYIGESVFQDCESLQSVKIPDSVTSIGSYAFLRCSSLAEITIPKNVSFIDYGAFSDCTSLELVIMQSKTPPELYEIYSDVFDNCPCVAEDIQGIRVPAGAAEVYKADYSWMKYGTHIMEEHSHDYEETVWKSNETTHWHECSCGTQADVAAHTEGTGVVTKEPTETETGVMTYNCSVCGYEMRRETIPAKENGKDPGEDEKPDNVDDSGEISKEVKAGVNAPAADISMSAKDLASAVLTEAEKQQVESGANISILLTVEDAGSSVGKEDKDLINTALNNWQVGQYLDISLFKIIGDSQNRVTETTGTIRITITLPDALKHADSTKTRDFAMLRIHNGEISVLNDLDEDADTITIDTNCFSTYVILYQEQTDSTEENGNDNNTSTSGNENDNNSGTDNDNNGSSNNANNNNGSAQKDKEPKTGHQAISLEIYATIAMIAGLSYLILYLNGDKNGMTEEEKNLLTGNIIRWAHKGSRFRILPALAAIFLLLFYYHSIGKAVTVEWKEVYEK